MGNLCPFSLWPFRFVAFSVCGRFGLRPFRLVAVPVCGLSGLWPFWFVVVSVCGRYCLWPLLFVAVSICGLFGLWPFRFWPFRFVAVMTRTLCYNCILLFQYKVHIYLAIKSTKAKRTIQLVWPSLEWCIVSPVILVEFARSNREGRLLLGCTEYMYPW